MTSYYSTLIFHQNVSALIEQSSGNYNVRDNTLYKNIQYGVLPLVTSPLQNWMLIMTDIS
jgi:hypothetical protein